MFTCLNYIWSIFHKHNKGTIFAKALNLNIQQDKSTSDMENKNRSTEKVFLSSVAKYPLWLCMIQERKAALNLVDNFYNNY